ncbi:restriction endonuclease subunit S [uncultured Ruminococcus sp.]|uniref:restriction endonuclease subunit S n=1 Tax=uncultured Ruminococcus sp. TaxID=165186 RepID=UPI0025E97337|nr:restriction endonuclease subunit S [uncultured Ruminococcus sp.]
MDGLECSEILIKNQSFYARIDAEFFSKKNLFLQERLNASGAYPMKKYGALLDCSAFYPSITDYYSHDRSQIPFLRVNEIQNGLINITDETVFLPEEILVANRKTIAIAYPGDIIIAKGGNTLAKVGLVTDEFPCYATCRDVIILRTDNLKNLNKYYLWAFLHSAYGQGILWRSASQTGQPHLTLPSILEIRIPDITNIQNDIETLYLKSVEKKHQAESLYDSAQQQLLNGLQFALPSVSASSIAEKKLSDSFGLSGRLDAEYYQPKYDELFAVLSKQVRRPLGQLVSRMKSIEPGSKYYGDTGIPFIRVSDVSKTGIDNPSIMIPENIEPNIDRLYPKKDTILFSKDGSVGIAFKITEDMKAVTSSALLHLRVNNTSEILPDYLTLVLNSEIVQLQAERDASGAIIQHWKLSDIEKVVIPVLPYDMQFEIAKKVQQSFLLREKANDLIQIAVKAVELAIEDSEEIASKWLEENTRLLEG